MSYAFLEDLRRYVGRPVSLGKIPRILFINYGAQATFVFRFGKCLSRAMHKWWLAPVAATGWILYLPMRAYVRYALGIRIDLSAEIGPGLFICHLGNIYLSGCRLGCDCTVNQSTHIGPAGDGDGPVIGDRVWIGPHARVIGAYNLGSGSTVSAGAVIIRDLPERALCLGNPGRIIIRSYDNRELLS